MESGKPFEAKISNLNEHIPQVVVFPNAFVRMPVRDSGIPLDDFDMCCHKVWISCRRSGGDKM